MGNPGVPPARWPVVATNAAPCRYCALTLATPHTSLPKVAVPASGELFCCQRTDPSERFSATKPSLSPLLLSGSAITVSLVTDSGNGTLVSDSLSHSTV